ncbi:hypothetical protein [Lentibacillus salinarum]|uniref:LexA repressor DNA-binding domain-containing protein n=1 Tax=Lentibacillus salinarum TaxID=446820 RepID=A0ABW3ZZ62_9BACI
MFTFDNQLSDLERKLLIILQHNNKKGRLPSLSELQSRSGHQGDEIRGIINDLIQRKWIKEENGEWIVIQQLF